MSVAEVRDHSVPVVQTERSFKSKRALVFPGQGSQRVGMGKAVTLRSEGAFFFKRAEEILGFNLTFMMFEGPEEVLKRTENAQVALLVHSVALCEVLKAEGFDFGAVDVMTGHSLGEWTALVASGVLSFEEALRVVRYRGELMRDAAQKNPGAMAAVIGLDHKLWDQIPSRDQSVCVLANDNGGGQIVLSGHISAVETASVWAKEKGARVIALPVAGAFHSPLMHEAEALFATKVEECVFRAPMCPLVMNTTATIEVDPLRIKNALLKQMTGCIRWRSVMEVMREKGVREAAEIGSGTVLKGLLKRHAPDIHALAVGDIEGADTLRLAWSS